MSEFDDLMRRIQELETENRRLKLENREYQTRLEALVEQRTAQLRNGIGSMERSYDITLEALGAALELKDAETQGHSKRVTAFSIAIARAMRVPNDEVSMIARGAFLHDIGKIAIPHQIVLKPNALTPEETAIMREHCYRGYQMLQKVPFLAGAAEIVYSYHEHYDGTGYPRGLKGEQIPLGARIVAVANTLDSITSELPYRPAQSVAAAKREIQHWSGRQFDPLIVQVFLSMPENVWFDLRCEVGSQNIN